jgi:very-short-patch-repair endonuclease
LARNKRRDRLVNRTLRKLGWRVIRFWQHDLAQPEKCLAKVWMVLRGTQRCPKGEGR